ncbi:MAG: ABC transporter ATP-binding protein [Steroidobacteraceae bacterium]
MARIDLEDIAHRYGTDMWALQPMNMTWTDGGAYALLGPSGCGKTTLLNIISGLVTPTRGTVRFDGRDVTSLQPEARNIAQVFQFPVVYDTMTVFENLAFPLRNRGWRADALERRVQQVAEILDLTTQLGQRARSISADQKQKISLGRGLVRPDVAAVLFDEPLTVIDPALKWLLRRKLKQIHHDLKLSLIYVTHDQTEALTFADQVVVMSQGEVVQIGTAEALFEAPAHRFVGHFIGTPGMNFLSCAWTNGASIAGVPVATSSSQTPPSGATLSIGVRPEYLQLAHAPGPNRIPATVVAVRDQGTDAMVRLEIAGATAWAKLRSERPLPSCGPAYVWLPPERCALYADDRRVA